jgi:SpoVK/Ycf46/Vps4 family AAA+-type ATPase
LAEETEGFSGRNISDVCKHAERKWASKLIRKEVEKKLPTLDQYISSLEERKLSDLVI